MSRPCRPSPGSQAAPAKRGGGLACGTRSASLKLATERSMLAVPTSLRSAAGARRGGRGRHSKRAGATAGWVAGDTARQPSRGADSSSLGGHVPHARAALGSTLSIPMLRQSAATQTTPSLPRTCVCVEQRVAGAALDHRRQLPCQVVGIAHACVHAKGTCGGGGGWGGMCSRQHRGTAHELGCQAHLCKRLFFCGRQSCRGPGGGGNTCCRSLFSKHNNCIYTQRSNTGIHNRQ